MKSEDQPPKANGSTRIVEHHIHLHNHQHNYATNGDNYLIGSIENMNAPFFAQSPPPGRASTSEAPPQDAPPSTEPRPQDAPPAEAPPPTPCGFSPICRHWACCPPYRRRVEEERRQWQPDPALPLLPESPPDPELIVRYLSPLAQYHNRTTFDDLREILRDQSILSWLFDTRRCDFKPFNKARVFHLVQVLQLCHFYRDDLHHRALNLLLERSMEDTTFRRSMSKPSQIDNLLMQQIKTYLNRPKDEK